MTAHSVSQHPHRPAQIVVPHLDVHQYILNPFIFKREDALITLTLHDAQALPNRNVALPGGYTGAKLSALNNFWNTTDPAMIQAMIQDKHDDPSAADVIPFQPFLTAHHANTPLFVSVQTATLAWVVSEGGAAPDSQQITISGAPGVWTATVMNADWLSVESSSGNGPGNLTASVNPTGLALGDHQGSVVVAAGGKQFTVDVTLKIIRDSARFRVDRDGLSFENFSYQGAHWDHFKLTFPSTLMELPDGTPRKGPLRYFQSNLYQTIGGGGNCAGFMGVSLVRFFNLAEGSAKSLLSASNQAIDDPFGLPSGRAMSRITSISIKRGR